MILAILKTRKDGARETERPRNSRMEALAGIGFPGFSPGYAGDD
jgi:hypothetical protein